MTSRTPIDAVVLDILGTLVDEPGGLRAAIRAVLPQAPEADVDEALGLWQQHIETEQRRVVDGGRPFMNSEALDLEAAQLVAAGSGSPTGRRSRRWAPPASGCRPGRTRSPGWTAWPTASR